MFSVIYAGQQISIGVRNAAKYWKGKDLTTEEKCVNLVRDCMNAPLHCFGVHDNCDKYFCTKETTQQARDLVVQLKSYGLFLAILNNCQYYFANKATSLLAGYDNNMPENFNSLVAKYTGGKRVNHVLAGSYKGRTAIAAVHFNTKGRSTTTFQKSKYNSVTPASLKLEMRRKRKVVENTRRLENNRKSRQKDQTPGGKKKVRQYGDGHEDLDFTQSQYDLAKSNFLQQLEDNRHNRAALELETRGQRFVSRWSEIRQYLLTTSYFGRILNARNRNSYPKIVEDILYHNSQYSNNAATVHSRLFEKEALLVFCENYSSEDVDVCGIFIDAEYCFLGASPFRLYGRNAIIMVECPLKLYGKDIMESIDLKLIPFWHVLDGNIFVNKRSPWYIKIQGQLHICDRQYAFLVVYLGKTKYKIEMVMRDDEFWETEMKDELVFFFTMRSC
ncbi:hypothetical protein Bhyg_12552 [Pseudolycoriella hygida]|uniref:Uncharacterized protein n=1 Tax=Pseudolycoriella hygida TaxID=35572 RepID=A0A9Q0MXS2_9DIPT|nr:hypothetical protein Bhyg_12552 [Pseudolycoriella hygida]